MVQWISLLWNSNLVKKTQLPFLCKKSGAIALVLPGTMAGRLAGRPADEIVLNI